MINKCSQIQQQVSTQEIEGCSDEPTLNFLSTAISSRLYPSVLLISSNGTWKESFLWPVACVLKDVSLRTGDFLQNIGSWNECSHQANLHRPNFTSQGILVWECRQLAIQGLQYWLSFPCSIIGQSEKSTEIIHPLFQTSYEKTIALMIGRCTLIFSGHGLVWLWLQQYPICCPLKHDVTYVSYPINKSFQQSGS